MTLAAAAGPRIKSAGGDAPQTPWRITGKVKADPATARFEQLEGSYGTEDTALRVTGAGDIRFGASPLLRAALSAKQLDADKFVANGGHRADPLAAGRARADGRDSATGDYRRRSSSATEQIMLGGRPLQSFAVDLHADAKSWTVDRLDFRAPGTTRVNFSGSNAQAGSAGSFKGALSVDSSDPDTLVAWLQGRGEATYRSQKPLRLRGDVSVAADRIAIDAMKAEIDGGAVEGRIALSHPGGGSRFDGELKAERLDLDAATALARSLAGPQADWPDEARLSLDIGRATTAGQELRPLQATLGYDAKTILLERLKIGRPDNVTMEGTGNFDRADATGKLALNSSAASLGQITGLIAPLAPAVAARLNAMGSEPWPGAPETGARSRQESAAGRSRQCARGARPRCAAAQGRHHHHGKACARRRARPRCRGDRAQRDRYRDEAVVGAGRRVAGAARSQQRCRGGRGPRSNSRDRPPARGARRCG